MLDRIGATIGRDKMIPVYQSRADSLRQRAVLESIIGGLIIDPTKGVDLVDATATTAIALPNGRNMEFAFGSDGIAFARISDGKYYPIDADVPELYLEMSEDYDKLAKSRIRRIFLSPTSETRSRQLFELSMVVGRFSDVVLMLQLAVEQLERSAELLEKSVDLMDGIGNKATTIQNQL